MKDILKDLPNPAEFNMFDPRTIDVDKTYGELYEIES